MGWEWCPAGQKPGKEVRSSLRSVWTSDSRSSSTVVGVTHFEAKPNPKTRTSKSLDIFFAASIVLMIESLVPWLGFSLFN